jgi:DNA mismatch endonuclease, patch repair protein
MYLTRVESQVNLGRPWRTKVLDNLGEARRSEVMRGIGRQNTPPEKAVRRVLHRMGYRFRLHRKDLPGKPDVTLPKWKFVIFVHGCFWHGCPRCYTGHRVPKSNRAFWLSKVARNQARDARVTEQLRSSGWRVVTIWECETHDEAFLERKLTSRLRCRAQSQLSGRG